MNIAFWDYTRTNPSSILECACLSKTGAGEDWLGVHPSVNVSHDVESCREERTVTVYKDAPVVITHQVFQAPPVQIFDGAPRVQTRLEIFYFPTPIDPALCKLNFGLFGMEVTLD